MKYSFYALCLLPIFAWSQSQSTEEEIQHLLKFVAHSPCLFERNGDKHTGKKAVKHIQKKFDYFEDDIDTAEDFIELSASKSTMSKKKYKIYCQDKHPITSQEWLLTELKLYRQHTDKG